MKSNGTFKAAVNSGIIPITVVGRCDIYEYFLEMKNKHDKVSTTITIVSEDKKVCESTVYKIIKDFGC